MSVSLSGEAKLVFWITILLLGLPTLGLLPLYLWWVAHSQYPASLDGTGVILRNGKRRAYTEIAAVTPTPVKGGYWVDFNGGGRMTLSPRMVDGIDAIYAYLSQHSGYAFSRK